MAYGQVLHSAGAIAYTLHRKDIPDFDRNNQAVRKLEGLTVITDGADIITAWYHKSPAKKIRKLHPHTVS